LFEEIQQQEGTKITIKEAVKIALTDSYPVYSATKMNEISKEVLRQTKSSYYPKVSLDATYNRALLNPQSYTPLTDSIIEYDLKNTYLAKLNANWVLWTGGKIKNSTQYAKLNAQSSDYKLRDIKEQAIKSVINYCYTIIYASALVHVQETYLDIAKQHLEQTKERYKQGLSSNLDVLTQQVRVDNIIPELLQAKKNVELATLYLRQILNKDPETALYLTWTDDDLLVAKTNIQDINALYDLAYERKPELQVSKLAVDMAEANVKIAKAGHLPTLAAYGNYGYNGYTKEGLPDGDHYYWDSSVGLKLSLPIFEGFSVQAQIAQKEKYYEDAKASYENMKKNVRIAVKAAWLNFEEARKRVSTTMGVVGQAQENVNSKMLRFKNGLISQLELNDAISDLNTSNLSFVQAVYDAEVALSNLHYAVGMEIEDYE